MNSTLHLPRGSAARPGVPVTVTPVSAGWGYSGLRVLELAPGGTAELAGGEAELAVLPLAGSCVVEVDAGGRGHRFELAGRDSVFSAVSDFAYVPRDAGLRITSERGGRFALPSALATNRLDPAYGPAEKVPVELRGAGRASRQVNNFLAPEVFPADRLIAVEVLTPGGNWSSYPPHKHDEDRPPEESALEEIYYFEIDAHDGAPGFGWHRLYTADGEIDLSETVADGDVVLIPRGYHGPSAAAPGYDMYYLNVMAGPGERAWRFCDDPAHAWIRGTWAGQAIDPRLPMTAPMTGPGGPA